MSTASSPQPSKTIKKQQPKKISFEKVPIKLDIVAGIISGFFVSPTSTIVDKSVILNANGKTPLWTAVYNGFKSLLTQPHVFLRSFQYKWLLFVYSSTYTASNLSDHWHIDGVDPSIVKLMSTFIANTVTSIIKDKALAQRFGSTEVRTFPLKSYGLFFLRDIIAMAAAFTIPTPFGQFIQKNTGWDSLNCLRIAQLLTPTFAQLIGTPLHLLSLDCYNHPNSTVSQRLVFLRSVFASSLLVRILRFLPTYGIGGIFNIQLRRYFLRNYGDQ